MTNYKQKGKSDEKVELKVVKDLGPGGANGKTDRT